MLNANGLFSIYFRNTDNPSAWQRSEAIWVKIIRKAI